MNAHILRVDDAGIHNLKHCCVKYWISLNNFVINNVVNKNKSHVPTTNLDIGVETRIISTRECEQTYMTMRFAVTL